MFRTLNTHIHFVGIGGIGMSGIAEVLVNLGYRVSGTDLAVSETTQRLTRLGARVQQGHSERAIEGADVVVASSAVPSTNPEVVAARAAGVPVIPRAEMLAELMRLKQGICIAGSHGKTTTTSLCAHTLHAAGLDPTVVIGGKLNAFDSNARLGYGDIMVAEADESDGSFLYLSPTFAVITNVDREHLEHYGSFEAVLDAFSGFANRVPFYGACIVYADDEHVQQIMPRIGKRKVTYGEGPDVDYRVSEISSKGTVSHFRLHHQGTDLGEFELGMPGKHNVLNAVATIALCDFQGIHIELTRKALSMFEGVQRRFTLRGVVGGVTVYDDYGHHPTEITATLAGAREAFPEARLIAVFQPHRYTRVRDHLEGFPASLDAADAVVLTAIHPAGESPIPGISTAALAKRIEQRRPGRHVEIAEELSPLPARLAELAEPGDVIITLGAGSITHVSTALVQLLEERRH